jgi:biopolymer transport protein ExbD
MKFATPVAEEVSINLTPLIDIVFLLLIFFMISTTFQRETELEIALPEASAKTQALGVVSAAVLEIDSNGLYRLGTRADGKSSEMISMNPARLSETLRGISTKHGTTTLIIKADAKTSHQAVVRALDAAQKAGLKKIKFAAEITPS